MPFLIPNAGDTTGGNAFAALDQAEPDSLDFEILGNSSSGVFSGCAVTPSGATAVAVAAGVVILRGIPYAVTANAAFSLGAGPANNRFDIVVARITGGTAVLTAIPGSDSPTNPTYPKSKAVTGSGTVDLTTDVVLAAVYRPGSATPTVKHIIDKRRLISSSIPSQGASPPSAGVGDGPGNLYFQTGVPIGTTTSSGVWVKTASGTWMELAQNVAALAPIGAMWAWPGQPTAVLPTGWLLCDGSPLATVPFAALFSILGYQFGGSGFTFKLPDMHHKFPRGTTSASEVGTVIGADTVTPPLTPHYHGLANHTHTLVHSHGIDHNHGVTTLDGIHHHDVLPVGAPGKGLQQIYGSGPNSATFYAPSAQFNTLPNNQLTTDNAPTHAHIVPAFAGSTTSQSAVTTSGSSGETDVTGDGGDITIIPTSVHLKWIIRASIGPLPA